MTDTKRTPTDVLRESRAARSKAKRRAVLHAVDEMRRDGSEITFASVARAANVSAWLVYADGMREYIEGARIAQAAEFANEPRTRRGASPARLDRELQLARRQNKKLRDENARLKQLLQKHLGDLLDEIASISTQRCVDGLAEGIRQCDAETTRLTEELAEFLHRLLHSGGLSCGISE